MAVINWLLRRHVVFVLKCKVVVDNFVGTKIAGQSTTKILKCVCANGSTPFSKRGKFRAVVLVLLGQNSEQIERPRAFHRACSQRITVFQFLWGHEPAHLPVHTTMVSFCNPDLLPVVSYEVQGLRVREQV